MALFLESNVRSHVDRLCETDAFRAAPTLCRVLRFLVEKSLEADDSPVGQRLVAEQALGADGETRTASVVAARMQIGRLRKLLAEHYAGPGRDDPVRIEIPQRNYRLRFRASDTARDPGSSARAERTPLVVVEFAGVGLPPSLSWLPIALTGDFVVALAPYRTVAVAGPILQFADAAAAAGTSGFVVMGDVRADVSNVQLAVRLLDGWDGSQAWAGSASFPLEAQGGLPAGAAAELRRFADEVADETGAVACHRMPAAASRPPETLSIRDAVQTCWRFFMTGAADDLHHAVRATTAARAAVADSPVAVAHDAWMQFAAYLANDDPRARPPHAAITSLDRAQSLAPTDPWTAFVRAFGLWLVRDPFGPEAICRRLDGRPASGSFQGLLGSLLVVSGIDVDRGDALLAEAFRRAPEPLPLFAHAVALSRFRQGDLEGMASALGRSTVRTELLPVVLRMALACSRGDHGFARRLATMANELVPDCTAACEVMLRRLLHDDHVDALATALAPLDLDWFN